MKSIRWMSGAIAVMMLLAQGVVLAMNDQIKIYNAATGRYEEVALVVKSEDEWKKSLTPEQFAILRKHGTERAFTNPLNHNKKKGVYKCIGCGTDLFSSDHKFDSGTGWPSFWQPLASENVGSQTDTSLLMERTEVHCARCLGHLGHIFDDGPKPTGQRYCINGTVLKFVENGQE
jgi:peptide-methionine (R)-S-oxide reductase